MVICLFSMPILSLWLNWYHNTFVVLYEFFFFEHSLTIQLTARTDSIKWTDNNHIFLGSARSQCFLLN